MTDERVAMSRIVRSIARIPDHIARIGMVVSGSLVVVMMVLVTVDAGLRKLTGFSTQVAQEFSGYMLVAITFLSAGYGLRSGSFIRVTAFYERIPERIRPFVQLSYDLVNVLYVICLGYVTCRLVLSSYQQGTVSTQASGIPLYIPQLAMVVGVAVFGIAVLADIGADFRRIAPALGKRGKVMERPEARDDHVE